MQQDINRLSEVEWVIGNEESVLEMQKCIRLTPFADVVLEFLNALSKKVMNIGREYSDVVTFGFWCRKASLIQEKRKYSDLDERLGRGIVFHSTPSNVAVNFAYSFATGMLSGNANIVRLPAKKFEQVDLIVEVIRELLNEDYSYLKQYICFVKYSSSKEVNDYFSSICDSRVIWGGDETISRMRLSSLKPRANEITFADRHSFAVISLNEYMNADSEERKKVVDNFYIDTYYSDQNACTSPRIVFWYTDENISDMCICDIQDDFWKRINEVARDRYNLHAVQSVGKIAAFYKAAVNHRIVLVKDDNEYVMHMKIESNDIDYSLMDDKYNSGFFYECNINDMKQILPLCDIKCQTVSYYGVDKNLIASTIYNAGVAGVDRIVPMGKTMDFSLMWDGYDLIRNLSRIVNIE